MTQLKKINGNLIAESDTLTFIELVKNNKTNLYSANLRDVNLRGADLRSANLIGADLRDAKLIKANLIEADLRGANLRGAYLIGANLIGADLIGADLIRADLIEANLKGANLRDANLYGANLHGADLYGADLYGADLRDAKLIKANLRGSKNWQTTEWAKRCKEDLRHILSFLKPEIPNLIAKIKAGEINGTQYEGECCCLIGTLGGDKACNVVPDYTKGLHNYAEQLFWQIKKADTPENSEFSKLALEICEEMLQN